MLSQTTGYAITALGHLAREPGSSLLVKQISKATGIPAAYLSKIINTLAKKRFVATQRGIGGGVSLAKKPEDIKLYDICVALDDPLIHGPCMLGTADCTDERACPCHQFWVEHRDKELSFLRQMSLVHVAQFEERMVELRAKPRPAPRMRAPRLE